MPLGDFPPKTTGCGVLNFGFFGKNFERNGSFNEVRESHQAHPNHMRRVDACAGVDARKKLSEHMTMFDPRRNLSEHKDKVPFCMS